jgi:hypothetical protein
VPPFPCAERKRRRWCPVDMLPSLPFPSSVTPRDYIHPVPYEDLIKIDV